MTSLTAWRPASSPAPRVVDTILDVDFRFVRAFCSATARMEPSPCGMTCWHWVRNTAYTASNGSCVSRRCVQGLGAEACHKTEAHAAHCRQRTKSSVPGRCAKSKMGNGFHIHLDSRGLAVCRCSAGPVCTPSRRPISIIYVSSAVGMDYIAKNWGHTDLPHSPHRNLLL